MSLDHILFSYVSPVFGLLIICTNLAEITILVLRKKTNHFSTPLVYVLALSVSDLLVGIVIVCTKIVYFLIESKLLRSNEALNTALLLMKFLFLRMSLIMSILSLLALTIDRMRAVQVASQRPQKTAVYISLASGLISVILAFALFMLSRNIKAVRDYEALVFPFLSIPSVAIFVIVYVRIIGTIRQSQIKLAMFHNTPIEGSNAMKTFKDADVGTAVVEPNDRLSSNKLSCVSHMKKDHRLLKLSISVVLTFALCWIPLSTCVILLTAGIQINRTTSNICFLLTFSNSFINPILYFAQFQDLFKKICSVRFLKPKRQRSSTVTTLDS